MLFNSYAFLFLFLPVTLAGFFLLGHWGRIAAARLWLTGASILFYATWNPADLWLIGVSVAFNYAAGFFIARAREAERIIRARWTLAAGIAGNLILLGYYKYYAFALTTVSTILGLDWQVNALALPLAISFFTFTQIAYLVDAWHGETRAHKFGDYALFVTFFPHLIAGPIVLYRSLMPQFSPRDAYRFSPQNTATGLTLVIVGLAKKVLIADGLAPMANTVFSATGPTAAGSAWCGALAYTFQLYFDFSGYSDMAIGLARMCNVRFPQNFCSPYKAVDIVDFWRRWHITLSTFLRDHLYIPLGGNRFGPHRRYVNLFLTMLLGGLWHGAGWTFIVWGALHGTFLCINHAWSHWTRDRHWHALPWMPIASRMLTFLCVVAGWVVFRSPTLESAGSLLGSMAGISNGAASLQFSLQGYVLLILAAGIAFWAPNSEELLRGALPSRDTEVSPAPLWKWTPLTAMAAGVALVISVLHFSRISEFLYFDF